MSDTWARRTFGGPLIYRLTLAMLVLVPFQLFGEVRGIQLAVHSFFLWAILLVGLARLVISRGRLRVRRVPYLGLWLLYLLTVLIGFMLGPGNLRGPVQAIWAAFRNVELFLVYPLVVQLVDDERRVRALLGAILGGLGLAALFGIGQSLTGGSMFSGLSVSGNQRYLGFLWREPFDPVGTAWQFGAPFFRAHGPTSSPNMLGAQMNIGLAISGGLLLAHYPRLRPLAPVAAACAIFLLTLGLTLSRAAWVAAAVAAAMVALVQFRPRLRTLARYSLIALLLGATALLLPSLLPESIVSRIGSIGNPLATTEVQSRMEVWQLALDSIRRNPVAGIGTDRIPGSLLKTWGLNPPDLSPHNIYLAAAYQYGLPNLALLLGFFALMLVNGVRLAWRGSSPLSRGVGLGAIGLAAALAVHGLFDSLLLPQSMIMLFWSLQGLVAATSQSERLRRRQARQVPPLEAGQPA